MAAVTESVELADAFLAEFESDEEEEADVEVNEVDDETEETQNQAFSFENVTRLLNNPRVINHLARLEILLENAKEHKNQLSRDEEYPVIVASNELSVDLDNDILSLHKFIRDMYAPKFPELEQLVTNPIDYARVVLKIQNQMDLTAIDLENIVPAHTIMVIKITATTTSGKPLPADNLNEVTRACEAVLQLEEYKKRIFDYIASRMAVIAPNLCVLLGSDIAARLIALAGGLENLAKIPASNILILGQKKKTSTGFSRVATQPHAGLVYNSSIVVGVPPALRVKAARLVAGKVALLARVDSFHEDQSAETGNKFREDIVKKLDKLQEPPPMKKKKALPAPVDKPRKRRGGKRFRKLKEKFEQTDLRKQQNRMVFGKAQEEDEAVGIEFGMLGQAGTGSGKLRVQTKDTQKLSKLAAARMAKRQKKAGSSGATSGLASSLAFTPAQGIELIDPTAAAQKIKEVNATYFSNTGSFMHADKGKMSVIRNL
eukprot:TRINITY_DN3918_c0_g1_i1.p1 TRINITY_DN3918_c0_g1~~TRINITY_DN3918_c0_g1_i1.p1  ORF type:complete len:488 (-),score=141.31 TRINITY_DN3918_c0_g1_i1:28-1491(-)